MVFSSSGVVFGSQQYLVHVLTTNFFLLMMSSDLNLQSSWYCRHVADDVQLPSFWWHNQIHVASKVFQSLECTNSILTWSWGQLDVKARSGCSWRQLAVILMSTSVACWVCAGKKFVVCNLVLNPTVQKSLLGIGTEKNDRKYYWQWSHAFAFRFSKNHKHLRDSHNIYIRVVCGHMHQEKEP